MMLLQHDVVTQLATKIAAFSFAAAAGSPLARSPGRSGAPPVAEHRAAAWPCGPVSPAPPAGDTRFVRGTAPPINEDIRFVRVSAYDPRSRSSPPSRPS